MSAGSVHCEGAFTQALLNVEAAVPSGLQGPLGHSPARRFAVYRNNVYASLIDTLANRFPATVRLVGEQFFRAMTREYVEGSPPRSAVLLQYGADFSNFIAGFPPAAAVPYLADIARLEWAWHEAYHAADAEPMSQDALAALGARSENIALELHPSVGLIRSDYPIITIWELTMRDGEQEPGRLPADSEDAFVLRPELEVTVRRLPPGGAAFIDALRGGATLPVAAASALDQVPEFDLAANLAGLMRSGALVGAL